MPWNQKVPGEEFTYDDVLKKYYTEVKVETIADMIAKMAGYKKVSPDAIYKRRRILMARGEM